MLPILLLGLIIYTNARLAQKKGKDPVTWGFISFLAFFVAFFIVSIIYILAVYKGPNNPDVMRAHLDKQPLTALLLLLLGVGGMLAVRFFLEQSKEGDAG